MNGNYENRGCGFGGPSPTVGLDVILAEKRRMGLRFSRCGWATLAVVLFLSAAAVVLGIGLDILEQNGVPAFSFFDKYYLLFNEALVACGVGFGALFLLDLDTHAPVRRKFGAKSFFVPLFICFPVAFAGSVAGEAVTNLWSSFTGDSVVNQLDEVLTQSSPWLMLVCVGLIAPIIEEFFFRKLLIDRLHKYGDAAAIVISALLFGLFHQNFNQFFYAAGIGLVLGYMYCRTGSYPLTVALHMSFNLISGVWPAVLTEKLQPFFETFEALGDDVTELAPELMQENALSLAMLFLYLAVIVALDITGLVLFIKNVKKLRFESGDTFLLAKEKRRAAFVNAGMLTVTAVLALVMITSLNM